MFITFSAGRPSKSPRDGEFLFDHFRTVFSHSGVALFEFPNGTGSPNAFQHMSELKCKIDFAGMGPESGVLSHTHLHLLAS